MAHFTVFGNPIDHSLSPRIHQLFAEQYEISLTYDRSLTSPAQFRIAVADFFRRGGNGANVTLPFKQQALELVTHISDRAAQAGAVNTLIPLGQGQLLGDNTDGLGLIWALQQQLSLVGQQVILIGAGGAARGVIKPLLAAGVASISIYNRSSDRVQKLLMEFAEPRLQWLTELSAAPSGAVVINATSVSLVGGTIAGAEAAFENSGLVYDMVYSAQPTSVIEQARRAGAQQCCDGLGMLVAQAAYAFSLWHDGNLPNIEKTLGQLRAELVANNNIRV